MEYGLSFEALSNPFPQIHRQRVKPKKMQGNNNKTKRNWCPFIKKKNYKVDENKNQMNSQEKKKR